MKKLAVVFPGVGYHVDKPLLYYSRKLATELGYDVAPVEYRDLPVSGSIRGDADKMRAVFEDALRQSCEILKDVDFTAYDRIVFIGKSVGTVVAGAYAVKMGISPDMLIYTPVEATFGFLNERCGTVFHGTSDGWVDTDIVKYECDRLKLPLHIIENANHSLETGNVPADILYLHEVMRITRECLLDKC